MDEFKFLVYNDTPETVLKDVFQHLQNDSPMKALDRCCQYYAGLNSQVHVNAAIDALKKFLEGKGA